MFKISVINANDKNRMGDYIFHKNLIYVGSNSDADLYAPTEEVQKNHIFLEVIENDLLIHLGKEIEYILINTKRTISFKKLKVGDTVQIGTLILKIEAFELTEKISTREYLKNEVERIKKNNPDKLKVLKSLSDAL